jgi:hypothetical protein
MPRFIRPTVIGADDPSGTGGGGGGTAVSVNLSGFEQTIPNPNTLSVITGVVVTDQEGSVVNVSVQLTADSIIIKSRVDLTNHKASIF